MNRVIVEGKPNGEFNASSKARIDCLTILENEGYQVLFVPSKYGVQTAKIRKPLQWLTYKKNLFSWMHSLDAMNPGDRIIIQYPLLNTTSGFSRFLVAAAKKGIQTVALIHDVDSLRFTKDNSSSRVVERVQFEDRELLPKFSTVISHNKKMSSYLKKIGCNNLIEIEAFDYLTEGATPEHILSNGVTIAGNLSPEKAAYLKMLASINCRWRLYGAGYREMEANNIVYSGKLPPDILPLRMKGAFGLVWDGDSIDGCKGSFGNYLRYNNPHKLSLYIASGLPVIVWDESAEADFVIKNRIGFTINTLSEIPAIMDGLSESEYSEMLDRVNKVRKKVTKGYFLRQALGYLDING